MASQILHTRIEMRVKCPKTGKEHNAYKCLRCPHKLKYNEWMLYCRYNEG